MRTERDNVKAGLFVLLGLVLTLVVIFTLADFGTWFASTQQVKVYYSLADGLQGLKEGAEVHIGGQPAGEVVRIEDFGGDDGGPIRGKIVTIEIPRKTAIYWDARIELDVPTIGTNTNMNIASVGRTDSPRYDEDGSIPGDLYREAFPEYRTALRSDAPMRPLPQGAIPGRIRGNPLAKDFAGRLGIGDLQRAQLQESIDNIKIITDNFAKISIALGAEDSTLAETIRNIHSVTATLKTDIPEMTASGKRSMAKVEKLLDDADLAMADVQSAIKDVKTVTGDTRVRAGQWLDRIDSITKAADESLADVRKLVADKDPVIREALDNVRDITRTVKTETMEQIKIALGTATEALGEFKAAGKEVNEILVAQRPVIERALANAELTTSQLKLAAIEVRRSPWRLLYEPGDEELETDNLYDAARSFALAATTLDAAAESLKTVAQRTPENTEQINRMTDDLEKLFAKFKEAENEFWKALRDRKK